LKEGFLVFGGVKNNAALEERCQSEENVALDGRKKKHALEN